ncbi:hypothetical protein F2Q68_00027847 [Brassica cretica]|uniref:Uncharacterized protein n=1 Tax=Brassica cretica TaxID=69181 RepID=A0A8S9IBL0_BRACR|nr:hypothetical protein F2Q68_00027847 [Brassica cretica]
MRLSSSLPQAIMIVRSEKGNKTTTLRSNLLHQLIENIPTGDPLRTLEPQHIDHIKLRQALGRREAPTVVPTRQGNARKVVMKDTHASLWNLLLTATSHPLREEAIIERGSPRELDQPPVPQEALNVAMEEVRDVLLKYTKCADPTEREARLERVRQAEEQGQMEENALIMVRASQNASAAGQNATPPNDTPERIPATQRLGPDPHHHTDNSGKLPPHPISTSRERLPATLRLGSQTLPIEHTSEVIGETQNAGNIGRLLMNLRLGPCLVTDTEGGAPSAPIAGKRKP